MNWIIGVIRLNSNEYQGTGQQNIDDIYACEMQDAMAYEQQMYEEQMQSLMYEDMLKERVWLDSSGIRSGKSAVVAESASSRL